MARRIAVVCVWLGLVSPAGAYALGLGDIQVRSALNQPLEAEIELISAAPGELADLKVALASRDAFDRYGIERPAFLSGLEFDVARGTGGGSLVRVTSLRPVSEPFLTFLVEATWPRGRLLREYTVLLDPPVYMPEETRAAPSPARVEPEPRATGPINRPASTPARAEPARSAPPRTSAPAGEDYGPVVRNETLWSIANRLRGGVTVNQMMIALYRANPEAFNGNINLLRAGAVLRMPDAESLDALGTGEANSEVARQNDTWQSGREAVAATSVRAAEPSGARLRLVAPSGTAGVDETAGGAVPGQSGAGDETATLRKQVDELKDELEETRRLIELKDSELAAMQARLTEQDQAATGTASPGAPGVDLETETAPGAAVEAPAGQPPAAAPETATIRENHGTRDGIMGLLGSTWLYVGLGIALLLATMLIFARRRREPARPIGRWEALDADDRREAPAAAARTQRLRTLPDEDESIVVVEQGARRTTAAPSARKPAAKPEAETPTGEEDDTLSSATAIHLDHADPLAEADFHMAYGLYDQAAELVRKASDMEPDRRDLRMKLLEIYFVWGNEPAFLDEARRLHDSMQDQLDADWDKTLIMGKQICPGEALFGAEPGSAGGSVDVDLAAGDPSAAAVDFVTGGDGETALDMDFGESADDTGRSAGDTLKVHRDEGALDFDFGSDEAVTRDTGEGSTIEVSGFESPTVETPTLEQAGLESPTVESPTLETERYDEPTMETPTIRQRIGSALESGAGSDQTAEIDLDDLGLDLDDLREDTLGGSLDEDETLLADAPDFGSDREEGDDSGTRPAARRRRDRDVTAEVAHFGTGNARDIDATTELDSLDLDVDESAAAHDAGDTAAHPAAGGGDTVRQPRYQSVERPVEDDALDVDLTEILTEDDNAFAAARDFDLGDLGDSNGDSEVGTKLDLARAYMDMGDPDGAQSILQEVLEEGDASQREEAQRLLNTLP